MLAPVPARYLPAVQAALRIVAGSAYAVHGAQKSLGLFGGFGSEGGTAELMSRFGAAGWIEVILGLCIILGFQVRLAAFLAAGQMAVAYFWMHAGGSGRLFWWQNGGELPLLYSFIFLVFAAWGAGPASIDASLARGRSSD